MTLQLEIKKIEEAAEKEKRAKQLQIDHLASMQVNQEKQINQVYYDSNITSILHLINRMQ